MAEHPSIEEFAELYGLAVGDPEAVKAYRGFQFAQLEYQSHQDYLARKEREATERALEKDMQEDLQEGERSTRLEIA